MDWPCPVPLGSMIFIAFLKWNLHSMAMDGKARSLSIQWFTLHLLLHVQSIAIDCKAPRLLIFVTFAFSYKFTEYDHGLQGPALLNPMIFNTCSYNFAEFCHGLQGLAPVNPMNYIAFYIFISVWVVRAKFAMRKCCPMHSNPKRGAQPLHKPEMGCGQPFWEQVRYDRSYYTERQQTTSENSKQIHTECQIL